MYVLIRVEDSSIYEAKTHYCNRDNCLISTYGSLNDNEPKSVRFSV